MEDSFVQSLVTTLQHRPYVAAFLAAYLVIGLLNRGLARTLIFLAIGYPVAFLSEFCSIRWGFPYGMYLYLYENMPGELILGGVPVWDSVSYVFMAYASYEVAGNVWGRWLRNPRQDPPLLLSALFMTLLDVVTDPLAVRGEKWFLGTVFHYPKGGIYFGVPLSNFAGWFLVGLVIFSLYAFAERRLTLPPPPRKKLLLGVLFYFSILLFNLVITVWIGEWFLGLVDLTLFVGIGSLFLLKRPSG